VNTGNKKMKKEEEEKVKPPDVYVMIMKTVTET